MHLHQVHAFGQDESDLITLSGKVGVIVDSSGLFFTPQNSIENDPYAIPGATVVVMDLDSTVITGAVANQTPGIFKIERLTDSEYIFKNIIYRF